MIRYAARAANPGVLSLVLLLAANFSPGLANADAGFAVAGSYLDRSNAERVAAAVAARDFAEAGIAEALVGGATYYRVQFYAADARAAVRQLQVDGFSQAFYLPAEATTAAPALTSAPLPHQSPVAVSEPRQRATARQTASDKPIHERIDTPIDTSNVLPTGTNYAAPASGYGVQSIKGDLNGIPMHRLPVQTIDHDSVEIKIDGNVDEPIWSTIAPYDNMIVSIPGTGEPAGLRTEIRLLSTERGLYVSSKMFQPSDTLVRRMTRRDEFIDRDNFGVTIDTTGEGKFAYWFIIALGDSLMDGKVLPERRYSNDWDGPWFGRSSEFDGGWSVELYFPWSMMSLPDTGKGREIGFAASRTVSFMNERYQWPGHAASSPQFVTALNTLQVDGVAPRQQVSVIPYVSTTFDEARNDDEARAGADLAWRPSPRLELTATVNPDFGAVEADDVVLNLTALETFFPEKRLFFLEGNEVFESTVRASFGSAMRLYNNEDFATTSRRLFITDYMPAPISMLNTRRIGGTHNQVTVPDGATPNRGERDRPTDLLGAVKVTGASGGLRYGVLGAAEDETEWRATDAAGNEFDIEDDGRNFGVARLLYEHTGKNRYSVGYLGTHVGGPIYDATVHGVDAHFLSSGGKWSADLQLVRSDVDDVTGEGGLLDIAYTPNSNFRHSLIFDYFDENVDFNDLGFLRRNDYGSVQYVFGYANAKGGDLVKSTRGAVTLLQQYNVSEGQVVDSGVFWRNTVTLSGRNTVRTAVAYFPERFEDIDSRGNGAYRTRDGGWVNVLWSTDASQPLSYSFGVGAFTEHLGDLTYALSAGVTYRPTYNFSVKLDVRYQRRDGWLVYQGGRNFGAYRGADWRPSVNMSWFIAPKHQLLWTLQWAGVRADERGFFAVPLGDGDLAPAARTLPDHDFNVSLLTTQLRYRWEIAPLTDLFVVYNRGNNLRTTVHEGFDDLFTDSFEDPVVDLFVVKLRYRFGN